MAVRHVDKTVEPYDWARYWTLEGLIFSGNAKVEQVSRAVEQISGALGEIGLLVNNAGVLIARPFEDLTLEEWDATMATNVRSLFVVTRAVLPGMRRRGEGTVVNVASLAARNGFAGGAAYTASKHAVLGFARSLMLEVRKEGIRVITICPGSPACCATNRAQVNPQRILQPEDAQAIVAAVSSRPRLVKRMTSRPQSVAVSASRYDVCRRMPFAEIPPLARAGGGGWREPGDRVRRRLRPVPPASVGC
jgi:NAD(P)-dependent dehydrogenase (short-subunit alcohol dehydrogenase family)